MLKQDKKGILQLNKSTNNPVNVGPIAGALCTTTPANPIANPRCSAGNNVNTVNCINGKRMPAPIAWIIRDIIKIEKVGENAATIDPRRKIAIEKIYKWRVEYLSIKKSSEWNHNTVNKHKSGN